MNNLLKEKIWSSGNGEIEICFQSDEPVILQGDNRKDLESTLSEYGVWTDSELSSLSKQELVDKLVWIAEGDIEDGY